MTIALLLLALALQASLPAPAPQAPPQPAAAAPAPPFPDTAEGRCAQAWIELVADGDAEAVAAFERGHASAKRLAQVPVEERARRLDALRAEFGRFSVAAVELPSPNLIRVRGHASLTGPVDLEFRFSSDHKLDSISIAAERSSGGPGQPIDATRRAKLVEAACQAMIDAYVFPEKGRAMAEAVRSAAARGAYDDVTDEKSLGERLTADFRAVTNDKHLRVRLMPEDPTPHPEGPSPEELEDARQRNWFFRSCEIAPGNIGVLAFDRFIATEEAMQVADAAMAFLGRCDALVFDLRQNGGGSPDMITHLTSYLFDEPTLLNRMIDREGNVVAEATTAASVPGRRFPKEMPVFVVTSGHTFSGAEEFSYNLQNLGRATIVGETTGGGAHPIQPVRLDDRMIVMMPYLRAENPITKTNWEGVGVKPEVEAPADQALDKALELARRALGR